VAEQIPFKPRGQFGYVVRSEFSGTPKQQAEWNRWYDEVDLPEMLALKGIHSATRYRERGSHNRYLTMYDIESPAIFETADYKAMAGWREWAPHILESRRLLYQLNEDLGPVLVHADG
jgi:hypothetical protein